jgi:hypothetical protein
LGYQSEWAKTHLPTRRDRNEFYTRLGRLTPPTGEALERLRRMSAQVSPADFLKAK